jgi:hypothetical protein
MRLAQYKLPVKTKFISLADQEAEGVEPETSPDPAAAVVATGEILSVES